MYYYILSPLTKRLLSFLSYNLFYILGKPLTIILRVLQTQLLRINWIPKLKLKLKIKIKKNISGKQEIFVHNKFNQCILLGLSLIGSN